MEWSKLLSAKRIRHLFEGPPEAGNASEETRSELLRDYGRAVFCTPVRRLQDKAQVFPLERIDLIRTRLTHSLEVSSMARGIANGVGQKLAALGKVSQGQAYDIETVAATVALLHDIGNPPFGHFGERAIRDWFERLDEESWGFGDKTLRKDFLNFEGNAQTLRLLSRLQVLSDRYGLNLTSATFSALSKYTASSNEIGAADRQSKKKLGYFQSESDVIQLVREEVGSGDGRHPICFLVEASDDMVYSIVDLEDGIKKRAIDWSVIKDVVEGLGNRDATKLLVRAEEGIKKSRLHAANSWSADEGMAQFFRTFLMVYASDQIQRKFVELYDDIMAGSYDREMLFDTEAGQVYAALKELGKTSVYSAKEILSLELLGHNVICSLLNVFSRADRNAKKNVFAGKAYELMSQNYRVVFENPTEHEKTLPEQYRKFLLITDYVCGMTDSFALHLHQQLTNG